MRRQQTRSGGQGLERSCRATGAEWIVATRPVAGVELFTARLARTRYDKHRHETYAVGVTDAGLQVFDYRGAEWTSGPGQVVVLHPDEVHDGRAGTADGFGYRIVYLDPGRVAEAARVLRGRPYPLPFVREPVVSDRRLSRAIRDAFTHPLEPLAADSLVLDVARALLRAGEGDGVPRASRRLDVAALERARQFLDTAAAGVVHSRELESITGLSRYDVARQFRVMFGTSPYRYLLGRRLQRARQALDRHAALADIATDTGFADQAHFTRIFKSAVGLTPGRYRALRRREDYTTSSVRAVVSPNRPSAYGGSPA